MTRAAALLLVMLAAGAALASEGPACGAPPDLLEAPPLPIVAAARQAGRLHILAVGSASITSPGVSRESATFAARLERIIAERRPGIDIRIEVRGGRGLTAADQWALIETALGQAKPDLVIWQAGAAETVRGLPVVDMTDVLTEGLTQLDTRGIDAVVMDLQFSRFLRANAEVAPYEAALRVAASAGQAAFFPRYQLMHAWAEAGTVDVERSTRPDRAAQVDKLNDCLAQAMALFLRNGAREAGR